jgi:hypothetical protein
MQGLRHLLVVLLLLLLCCRGLASKQLLQRFGRKRQEL